MLAWYAPKCPITFNLDHPVPDLIEIGEVVLEVKRGGWTASLPHYAFVFFTVWKYKLRFGNFRLK
jgi:hypothetical protein